VVTSLHTLPPSHIGHYRLRQSAFSRKYTAFDLSPAKPAAGQLLHSISIVTGKNKTGSSGLELPALSFIFSFLT